MPQHEIKINLPGLLRILGENIYAEPDVAIREMIQNAHDTSIVRRTQDKSFTHPQIEITFDRAARTLTINDTGAGMTEPELHNNLATIGESFTRVQRERLRGEYAEQAALLIGQFGIGMLSAFSVARRVEFLTRSCQKGSKGCKWTCEGDIHYTVERCPRKQPGTEVVLHLLDNKLELLDENRLRQAIKKYADFLSIPILLNGHQVNAITPPWEAEGGKADLVEYIRSRWDLFPLGIIPFNTAHAADDGQPMPSVSGLLFVPMIPFELTRDFGEVDVYISRMFIKANDKDLLPRWAHFVKGVINTPELTPTLSRGELIVDAAYQRVRDLLGAIILGYLEMLQQEDPDKLQMLVGAYNNTIKARALEDDGFFDHICDLVRVSTDAGLISMSEYLKRSDGVIYYFAERGSGTQHKLLFSYKGLPVIDASWGVEMEFLERYAARRNVRIQAASSARIFKVLETVDEKWQVLERDFFRTVKKEAKAVEFEPEGVPAVLVAKPLDEVDKRLAELNAIGAQAGITSASIQQMFKQMAKSKSLRASESDTVLNLNTKNQLICELRDMPRSDTFYLALTCIYNNAVMFAHHYVSPENAEIIFTANSRAVTAMIGTSKALAEEQKIRAKVEIERDELQRRLPRVALAAHRTCFFAFDYKIPENYELLDQVQRYFNKRKLGIEVLAPASGLSDLDIIRDLDRQLAMAHFGLIEISVTNANVLFEAGILKGMGKPAILLRNKESVTPVPFDIFGTYRAEYEVSQRQSKRTFVWLGEELNKAMQAVFRMVPGLERVPKWDRS